MTYRLRPEWAPQRGVFLVWPHPYSDWRDKLTRIHHVYAQWIALISPTEEVYLLCHDHATETACREFLKNYSVHFQHLHTIIVPSNDTWIRDFGPLSLDNAGQSAEDEFIWANFRFNAWGGKYDYQLDHLASHVLSKQPFANPMVEFDWILEGGAIDVNDDGVLITTANCMLNPNRNPFTRQQVEQRLINDLGVKSVLILESGMLLGDDTDSHVDNLVRFANNDTVLYCRCDNKNDEHFESLYTMRQQLENWNQSLDKPFTLVPIALPEPVYSANGNRLAASYLNFLILNHVVVVPSYHSNDNEKAVMQQFEALFPHRAIVSFACKDLVVQGGGPHCASMQFS